MGTGYTRNDTSNNIADGNIINASDLDGEFDAVESAFNSSTGHTHDGTAAEGGAITVVGPVQDLVVSATEVKPKTTNTLDLGTSALLYKDAYLQGNMYFRDTALKIVSSADGQLDIDADVELELVAPTVDIDASTAVTIDTASTTFTSTVFNVTGSANITGDLDVDNININGNTIISTDTNGDINISPDGTGTVVIDTDLDVDNINVNGNTVSSTDTNGDINLSPNGTGTVVINTDLDVDNININGNTIISTDTNGNIALTPNGTGEVDISKVDIDSGAIDGTVIGASSAAAITGTTITGTSFVTSGDMTFGDNDKAIFGADSDLEISHSGTENVIDSNSGTLVLRSASAGTIELRDQGSQVLAQFNDNSDVKLYYNNNEKLATTSTGVDVTGSVTADDLNLDIGTAGDGIQVTSSGANYLNLGFDTNRTGASQTLSQIEQKWNGTAVARILFVTGSDTTNKDDAEIRFQTASAGTPTTAMTIGSSGNVDVSSTDATVNFVSSRGAGATHTITTGGANSLNFNINAASSGDIYVNAENKIFRNAAGSTEHMRIDSSGNVDVNGTVTADGLTVSGDAVFEPDNDGVRITGTNYATLRLEENDTTDLNTTMFNSAGKFSIYTSSDDRASATERVTLDHSTGNVTTQCSAGNNNFALAAYHPTSTSSRTIAKFQSNVGGTQQDKVVIKCDGDVGIGTSSPSYKLSILEDANNFIQFSRSIDSVVGSIIGRSGGANLRIQQSENASTEFWTNNTERMRITNNGKVGIGTTSISSTLEIVPPDTNSIIETHSFSSAAQNHIQMRNNSGTEVGTIYVTTTSTAYNTSSDYRLKTAVEYDWDATSRLKQLKPARFEWIVDGDDAVPVDGFLAHEVQDIVPEAITGTKDAMRDEEYQVSAATGDIYTPAVAATYDEDDVELTAAIDEVIHNADVERPEELAEGQQWRETTAAVMGTRSVPDYQGIDQSKLTPLLTKALIEAVEKIEQLEARIAALEAN